MTEITVKLRPWQLAQLERLLLTEIDMLKRDGLSNHNVTKGLQELYETLGKAS